MRNSEVVAAWVKGNRTKSSNGNLSTDGHDLFSYQMKIGRTKETERGMEKQVLSVQGKHKYTLTTQAHVRLAQRKADKVIEPVYRYSAQSYHSWRYFPDECSR